MPHQHSGRTYTHGFQQPVKLQPVGICNFCRRQFIYVLQVLSGSPHYSFLAIADRPRAHNGAQVQNIDTGDAFSLGRSKT